MTEHPMTRRGFVRGALVGGSAFGLGLSIDTRSVFAADVSGKPAAGKIGEFKISLAEWSLNKALFRKEVSEKTFGRVITNLDFPQIAREQFGIDGVEFVNQFFKDR